MPYRLAALRQKNRCITVKYRTFEVKVKVSSLQEEVTLRLAAWLKSSSVGGDAPAMQWEELLFPIRDSVPVGRCDAEVLSGYVTARNAVDAFLTSDAATT